MKKRTIVMTFMIAVLIMPSPLFAIETAPRISDREIVERLTRLEEGQKSLEGRIDNLDKGLNNRIDDLRSEMNSRFNTLQWMLGLFITIALVILGFVLRMQWQMNRRQSKMETMLETHKDEIAFLKGLIEKLLPPKGVL
jgi:preprotein translocase subunit YajC